MKRFLTICCVLFYMGCKPKLNIYNQHALLEPIKRSMDNSYTKDFSGSYDRLSGDWIWTEDHDTLVLNFKTIYKKKYEEKIFGYKNAYYDTSQMTIKYFSDGKVKVDSVSKKETKPCFYVGNLEVLTTMFRLFNRCQTGVYDHPILMFAGNDLVLINKWSEEKDVFFEREGEYKIVIPRTITLKRME